VNLIDTLQICSFLENSISVTVSCRTMVLPASVGFPAVVSQDVVFCVHKFINMFDVVVVLVYRDVAFHNLRNTINYQKAGE